MALRKCLVVIPDDGAADYAAVRTENFDGLNVPTDAEGNQYVSEAAFRDKLKKMLIDGIEEAFS